MKAASLPPSASFVFNMELAKDGVITLDYADQAVAEVTSGSSGELELTFYKPPKEIVGGNGSERQKLRVALAKSASASESTIEQAKVDKVAKLAKAMKKEAAADSIVFPVCK